MTTFTAFGFSTRSVSAKIFAAVIISIFTDPKIEMITAANIFAETERVENPNAVKVVMDRDSNALYFSRSVIPFAREKDTAPRYYRHQGIYGYSTRFLLRFVKWKPTLLE